MYIIVAVRQWREDMDFLYVRAGTNECSERMELACFCHENIKFNYQSALSGCEQCNKIILKHRNHFPLRTKVHSFSLLCFHFYVLLET